MKRLAIFLFGICLLASCEDIEDARTLPKEFSISNIVDVSELTYDELENLVINSNYYDPDNQKEEMRRSGGLIIKGQVTLGTGEAYNDAHLWFSTRESDLPTSSSDMWNGNSLGVLTASANTLSFYQNNQQLTESDNVSNYYYKLGLSTWDHEYPGFVDNCLDGGYYSQTVFSGVKTYTLPDVPCIFDCMMGGVAAITASFSVKSKYQITESGVCYSLTNQLPTVQDEVGYCNFDKDHNKQEVRMDVSVYPREAGTYYVRAFATSDEGIAYSPVQKISSQGGYVDVTVNAMTKISEIGYTELESLMANVDIYQLDNMRTNGGILIRTSVKETNYFYDNMRLWCSDNAGDIPNGNSNNRNGELLYPINKENHEHPMFFHHYSEMPKDGVFYYGLELNIYTNLGSYSTYPWEDKYTLNKTPFVYDCSISESGAAFLISSGYTVIKAGVCYSMSNDLPTVNDKTVLLKELDPNSVGFYIPFNNELPAGTYYVRAFVSSETGIGYSPVWKVTTY